MLNQHSTIKNCLRVCAYHYVQLSYATQHRTVLTSDNLPSHPPDNHRCSDDVYQSEGVAKEKLSVAFSNTPFTRHNRLSTY